MAEDDKRLDALLAEIDYFADASLAWGGDGGTLTLLYMDWDRNEVFKAKVPIERMKEVSDAVAKVKARRLAHR